MFIFTPQFAALLWLLLAIGLAVLEGATTQLVAIWFALGSIVTMFFALLGISVPWQLVIFAVVSLLSMVLTRPFLKRALTVRVTKTNADQIIGTIGVVVEDIDNTASQGRVYVGGLNWAARSEDGEFIAKDERVLIKEIAGVKVIVERVV